MPLLKFIFNWMIIASQCCVDFCHMTMWISHMYTLCSFLLEYPFSLHITTHPGHHRAQSWALYIQLLPAGCLFILSMIVCICVNVSLSHTPPSPSPLCPQVLSLCLCLYFCPSDRFIRATFLDSIWLQEVRIMSMRIMIMWRCMHLSSEGKG